MNCTITYRDRGTIAREVTAHHEKAGGKTGVFYPVNACLHRRRACLTLSNSNETHKHTACTTILSSHLIPRAVHHQEALQLVLGLPHAKELLCLVHIAEVVHKVPHGVALPVMSGEDDLLELPSERVELK